MIKKTLLYLTILIILVSLAYVIPHIINGIIIYPEKETTLKKEEISEDQIELEIYEPESNDHLNVNKSSINQNKNILLKVVGKNIVDNDDNNVKLSGFFIWTSDILYNSK